MSWTLIAPAAAIALALVALTVVLHHVEAELALLRRSLKRAGTTAVAAEELRRSTADVSQRIENMEADARTRIRWPRRARSGR